jgi:ABC-type lipoprotein release transport system permease subunit
MMPIRYPYPRALAAVAAMLLAVGVLPSWIPPREAVRLDPMETLRRE